MINKYMILIVLTGVLGAGAAGGARAVGVGEMCAGIAGIPCDGKLWCDLDPGQCGVADAAGKCVSVPEACTRIFKPVCGCDNKTYGNDCERQAAKVAKKADGECKSKY